MGPRRCSRHEVSTRAGRPGKRPPPADAFGSLREKGFDPACQVGLGDARRCVEADAALPVDEDVRRSRRGAVADHRLGVDGDAHAGQPRPSAWRRSFPSTSIAAPRGTIVSGVSPGISRRSWATQAAASPLDTSAAESFDRTPWTSSAARRCDAETAAARTTIGGVPSKEDREGGGRLPAVDRRHHRVQGGRASRVDH